MVMNLLVLKIDGKRELYGKSFH